MPTSFKPHTPSLYYRPPELQKTWNNCHRLSSSHHDNRSKLTFMCKISNPRYKCFFVIFLPSFFSCFLVFTVDCMLLVLMLMTWFCMFYTPFFVLCCIFFITNMPVHTTIKTPQTHTHKHTHTHTHTQTHAHTHTHTQTLISYYYTTPLYAVIAQWTPGTLS